MVQFEEIGDRRKKRTKKGSSGGTDMKQDEKYENLEGDIYEKEVISVTQKHSSATFDKQV